MAIPVLEDCDAWVVLHASYFNGIAVHVAEDGNAAPYDDKLMTLSTRILASGGEGLWIATRPVVKTDGGGASRMGGRFLIPWRHVEGIHLLDDDVPGHALGRMGFSPGAAAPEGKASVVRHLV